MHLWQITSRTIPGEPIRPPDEPPGWRRRIPDPQVPFVTPILPPLPDSSPIRTPNPLFPEENPPTITPVILPERKSRQ